MKLRLLIFVKIIKKRVFSQLNPNVKVQTEASFQAVCISAGYFFGQLMVRCKIPGTRSR